MKRAICFLLATVMVFAMALTMIACGGNDVTTTAATTTAVTTTAATTTKKQGPGIVIPKDYDGEGTEESPYLIENAKTLLNMAKNVSKAGGFSGKYFKMTANIDMEGQDWTPLATFNGVFDGDGYAIINLTVSGDATNYKGGEGKSLGAFASELNGTLKNVAFINTVLNAEAKSAGEKHVGLLVGKSLANAVFENVFVHGFVNGSGLSGDIRVATVSGYNDNNCITFKNVACVVSITGASGVHRLTASNVTQRISDCYVSFFGDGCVTANQWTGSSSFAPYSTETETGVKNFYSTHVKGADSLGGGQYSANGVAGFYDGKDTITSADFFGDAMGLDSASWNTYADGTPIQKVFEGKCDDYLRQVAK